MYVFLLPRSLLGTWVNMSLNKLIAMRDGSTPENILLSEHKPNTIILMSGLSTDGYIHEWWRLCPCFFHFDIACSRVVSLFFLCCGGLVIELHCEYTCTWNIYSKTFTFSKTFTVEHTHCLNIMYELGTCMCMMRFTQSTWEVGSRCLDRNYGKV